MDSRPDRSRVADFRRSERSPQRPGTRRTEYLDAPRSTRTSPQRGRRVPPQPQYTNLVQGRQAPGIAANLGSMLPLVVVGAIIIGLLILVLVLAFGGDKSPAAEDTPTVPISGMPAPAGTSADSGNAQNADTPTVEPVAPKNAIFSYSVADGKEAYIEVIVDGKTKEAETYTGPKTAEYPVTGELKFVTTAPDAVTITVDGEKVEPTESSSGNGIYHYTLNFDDVLSDWQKANGMKADSKDTDPEADNDAGGASADEDGSTQSGNDRSSASGDDEDTDR